MNDTTPAADVLIVGAGPVGLFLANECARRGLRWRVVEQQSGPSTHSKALAVMPRTLEIFDMAGLVEPFVRLGNHVTNVAVVSNARALARLHFAPEDSPFSYIAMVPQDVTEGLLADALRRRGGSIDYGTAFVTASQSDDGVAVTLQRGEERLAIEAAFVVGCDGAHSAVRHLLNLPFEGAQYRSTFLLADVETNDVLAADEMQLCPSAEGPLAIFPMNATRRRIVAMVDEREGDAPSLDAVRAIAASRAPHGFEVRGATWTSYFQVHHRQVARMRDRRMFVAGDAAHVHSPFGGQGMNTGLQDAWNLAWKLDLVVNGHAGATLLDTYEQERLPVVRHVIETTDFLTKALGSSNVFAQAARDTIIPIVSQLTAFQHAFVQNLSELGVSYKGSPIVEGAGKRYVDESLRGGAGIRSSFVLFVGADASADVDAQARRLAVLFRGVLDVRSMGRNGIAFVRPDGYLAYERADASHAAALEPVPGLLERHSIAATPAPGAAS